MAIVVSRVPEAYSRNPGRIETGEDGMPIQVFGGMTQAGGFKSAIKEHRTHNAKQGDELLQLADGLDHNDPRVPYEQRVSALDRAYPKMLFKPDPGEKGENIVLDATEEAVAKQDGWREEPYPRVQVAVLDPVQEKANLMDTNNRLQAQLVQQNEALLKVQQEAAETRQMLAELLSQAKKTK